MSEALVRFRDAGVAIGGRRIVGPLRFDVAAGETLVLLGRSGSGKTTTLRLVNGLVAATEGEIEVDGTPVGTGDVVARRRGIGYMIQEVGLFPHFTVAANVGVVPRLLGWNAARIAARVVELLDLVGLPPAEFAGRLPHELSGGQRQRVGVARALAAHPPLLLCDEPFGATDPLTRAELQREFRALVEGLGTTVLFVTHDVREALAMGTRIALFEEGTIGFLGDVAAFRSSDDPLVRAFRELA